MNRPITRMRRRLVQNLTGAILEIGAGRGPNLPYYAAASQVYAIEPDFARAQAAHTQAGRSHGSMYVVVAAAEFLPFSAESFDEIVSSLVFCSVNDPALALDEVERVIKPGGALHMVEHVRPTTAWLARLFMAITPRWSRIAHNCHLDRPTVDLLRNQGWRVTLAWRRAMLVRLTAHPPEVTLYPGARKAGSETLMIDR